MWGLFPMVTHVFSLIGSYDWISWNCGIAGMKNLIQRVYSIQRQMIRRSNKFLYRISVAQFSFRHCKSCISFWLPQLHLARNP